MDKLFKDTLFTKHSIMNYSRHYDFIMSTFDDWSQCRFNTNFLKITKESLENKTLYNNPKYVFDAIFVMSSLKFFGNTNRFYNSPSADDITAMLMDILTNVDPEYLFASKSELLHQNPFSAIIDLGRNKRKWKWNELDDTERMYIADQQNVWHVLLQHQKGDMSDDVYVSILRNIRFALEYPFDASEFKELYDKDNGKDVMYHIIPNQFSEERALAKEWALLMEGSTCPVDPSPFGGSEKMKLREKKICRNHHGKWSNRQIDCGKCIGQERNGGDGIYNPRISYNNQTLQSEML